MKNNKFFAEKLSPNIQSAKANHEIRSMSNSLRGISTAQNNTWINKELYDVNSYKMFSPKESELSFIKDSKLFIETSIDKTAYLHKMSSKRKELLEIGRKI